MPTKKTKVFEIEPIFKKSVLPSGLKVLTEQHPGTRTVAAGVFVPVGARDESFDQQGISHFLEHLVFKGTETRSAFEIASALESVGGDLNAYTSKEYTCFHATSLKEDLGLSLDVVLDLARQARFSEDDFEKERQVVIQEIAMSEDQMEDIIFDRFFEYHFGKHPLGQPILGTEKSLKKMKLKDLVARYENTFVDKHMIVVVIGDVPHEQVLEMVNQKKASKGVRMIGAKRTVPPRKNFRKFEGRSAEQLHVLLGMESVPMTDERRFEAMLVANALGGGMTSRLYQSVREKKGLAYSVYSQLMTFTDLGMFFIYAGTTTDNLKVMFEEFRRELHTMKEKGLTDEEVEFFRRQVRGQILIGSDDIENRMTSIGVNEMVFERYRPVDEVIELLDAVNAKSIRQYLDQYFDFKKMGTMILGDKTGWSTKAWPSLKI